MKEDHRREESFSLTLTHVYESHSSFMSLRGWGALFLGKFPPGFISHNNGLSCHCHLGPLAKGDEDRHLHSGPSSAMSYLCSLYVPMGRTVGMQSLYPCHRMV